MGIPEGDVNTFVAYSICDCQCGESHIDQQRYMAVPQIMDSNTLYAGCFTASSHFPVQIILADREDPAVTIEAVEHFEIVLHFIAEELRHLNHPNTLGGLGGGDHILLVDPLIGLGDADCATIKVEVGRGQRQRFSKHHG